MPVPFWGSSPLWYSNSEAYGVPRAPTSRQRGPSTPLPSTRPWCVGRSVRPSRRPLWVRTPVDRTEWGWPRRSLDGRVDLGGCPFPPHSTLRQTLPTSKYKKNKRRTNKRLFLFVCLNGVPSRGLGVLQLKVGVLKGPISWRRPYPFPEKRPRPDHRHSGRD